MRVLIELLILLNCFWFEASVARNFMKCPLEDGQSAFEVLPGGGWDNLRNVPLGRVYANRYESCRSSEDGYFLLPDNLLVEPMKQSHIQLSTELFQHYKNYTSLNSKSINIEVSGSINGWTASGSLSTEFVNIKTQQSQSKSVTSRVTQRHEFYTAMLQPDAELSAEFTNRLLDIVSLLSVNSSSVGGESSDQNPNFRLVEYLCDMVVRDFGSHVVTSVVAGALLSKVDHLKADYVSNMTSRQTNLNLAASVSFALAFKVNGSFQSRTGQSEVNTYEGNCLASDIYTLGGPPASATFNITEWEKNVRNNLVAIDRRGDPIFNAITPRSIPALSHLLVFQLARHIKDAVNRYYAANLVTGCMDLRSTNFNFHANIDSGDCENPVNNFTFGGVYQICDGGDLSGQICGSLQQANPATGRFSCSDDYLTVQLFRILVDCREKCVRQGVIFTHTECWQSCGYLSTYWCSPKPGSTLKGSGNGDVGFLMGGLFSPSNANPVTGSSNCPDKFFAVKFGIKHQLCLGVDAALMLDANIPRFGGFYSCKSGNPLADEGQKKLLQSTGLVSSNFQSNYPSRCGKGFAQMFGFIDSACEVLYCVQLSGSNLQFSALNVKRPPFVNLEFMEVNTTHQHHRLLPSDENTAGWLSDYKGNWILQSSAAAALVHPTDREAGGAHVSLPIFLGAIFGTIALGLLTVIISVWLVKRQPAKNGYECLQNEEHSHRRNSPPTQAETQGLLKHSSDPHECLAEHPNVGDYGTVNHADADVTTRVWID